MSDPKDWLRRGESLLAIGAGVIIALAFVIYRLFGLR
jgi:hypothetical protein